MFSGARWRGSSNALGIVVDWHRRDIRLGNGPGLKPHLILLLVPRINAGASTERRSA
jgi:hypothetical protein